MKQFIRFISMLHFLTLVFTTIGLIITVADALACTPSDWGIVSGGIVTTITALLMRKII